MAKELVLLTGGTGYLGFAILIDLLRSGYRVRVAARSQAKADNVSAAPAIAALGLVSGQLSFAIVPDMTAVGAYDDAVQDVTFIVHAAAPLHASEDSAATSKDQIEDALVTTSVQGNLGLLKSAVEKGEKVKRIVMTSSTVAIAPPEVLAGDSKALAMARGPEHRVVVQPPPYASEVHAYCASKAAALNEAEAFMKKQTASFDLISIMPSWIFGKDDFVTDVKGLRTGSTHVLMNGLLTGNPGAPAIGNAVLNADVARAHVRALDPDIEGNQSFVLNVEAQWEDTIPIAKRYFPESFRSGLFQERSPQPTLSVKWDSGKTRDILGIELAGCVLHNSTCSFGATCRKARAKHQEPGEDVEDLRLKIERLESSLGQALQKVEELQGLERILDKAPDVPVTSALAADIDGNRVEELQNLERTLDKPPDVLATSTLAADIDQNPVDLVLGDLSDARLELPPVHEVLSALERYLTTLNAVLPLFHPGRLLQSVNNWYAHPVRRERKTWAAINVVLALAHRQAPSEEATSESAAFYLNNAQTVLSELIMGDADLLSVQILIGMVLLFQGTQDLKPATMLIAVALRLAHELGLHTRRAEYIDASHLLERDRVFWIAYLLDRDISLRTSQPPVQRESDIDIERPLAEPEDGAGNVVVSGGNCSYNFFRCRVWLAQIQGEVHDFMVAARVGKMDDDQRDKNIVRLNRMLDDWMSSIPPSFRPDSVLQAGQPNLCRSFAILYSTHLTCRTHVYRAHAMASEWMKSLLSFGRAVTQRGHSVPIPLPTPSLQDWDQLINETRSYMELFWTVELRDQAFIWSENCTNHQT
ncbi:hypothetical protein G7046_g486 [Stylonectria norvegica]|nr:hypothetical protein G7046_g486 [Stylonectria norvegica]